MNHQHRSKDFIVPVDAYHEQKFKKSFYSGALRTPQEISPKSQSLYSAFTK